MLSSILLRSDSSRPVCSSMLAAQSSAAVHADTDQDRSAWLPATAPSRLLSASHHFLLLAACGQRLAGLHWQGAAVGKPCSCCKAATTAAGICCCLLVPVGRQQHDHAWALSLILPLLVTVLLCCRRCATSTSNTATALLLQAVWCSRHQLLAPAAAAAAGDGAWSTFVQVACCLLPGLLAGAGVTWEQKTDKKRTQLTHQDPLAPVKPSQAQRRCITAA